MRPSRSLEGVVGASSRRWNVAKGRIVAPVLRGSLLNRRLGNEKLVFDEVNGDPSRGG